MYLKVPGIASAILQFPGMREFVFNRLCHLGSLLAAYYVLLAEYPVISPFART